VLTKRSALSKGIEFALGHGLAMNRLLTTALQRMGYLGEQMRWHGLRAMASMLLNERGFPPDVIELRLVHKERNEVRAAYNPAQRIEEWRKMRNWADYLDQLRREALGARNSNVKSVRPQIEVG
jgi:integrase